MNKPQHEQYFDYVSKVFEGEEEEYPNTIEALARLRDEAAKVPGLEALLYGHAGFIGPCAHGHDPWTRCDAACAKGTAIDAVLERLAKAESERDVARQERDALLAQQQSNAGMDLDMASEVERELSALRERVATLEDLASDRGTEALEAIAAYDQEKARADSAEARVQELAAEVTEATARMHHVAERLGRGQTAGWARQVLVLPLKSQPPPAPAQGASLLADVLGTLAWLGFDLKPKEVSAIRATFSHHVTPTPTALVEAVGPFLTLGERVADTAALKAPNTVVAHVCDDGCRISAVTTEDFQRLRAAYDAARAAPVSVGLVEVVETYAVEQERLAAEAEAKSEREDDAHYAEACEREGRAAGAREVLAMYRAAYDAAKGGTALVHRPGCKQMAPAAEVLCTMCTAQDAHDAQEWRNTAEAREADAEDAAKYRAAVTALRDLDTYLDFSEPWDAGDLGIEDPSGINALFERVRLILGGAIPAPETLDKATAIAQDLGILLDTPPSGQGGES